MGIWAHLTGQWGCIRQNSSGAAVLLDQRNECIIVATRHCCISTVCLVGFLWTPTHQLITMCWNDRNPNEDPPECKQAKGDASWEKFWRRASLGKENAKMIQKSDISFPRMRFVCCCLGDVDGTTLRRIWNSKWSLERMWLPHNRVHNLEEEMRHNFVFPLLSPLSNNCKAGKYTLLQWTL